MKKNKWLPMWLLGVALIPWCSAQAGSLGLAAEFNVFIFDSIEQSGTDVEGRVAGGANVSYSDFSIASKVKDKKGLPDLVAGGNLSLADGSVGYMTKENSGGPESQRGVVVYGGTATIGSDVGYATISRGSPIDFGAERSYLTGASSLWGGWAATGQTQVDYNIVGNRNDTYRITLTGSDPFLNVFSLDGSLIDGGLGFYINAPVSSAILVNISGALVNLKDFGFYFNNIKSDAAGFFADNILFNFLDAQVINIDLVDLAASLLAPWAHVNFFKNSHIDGNLIARSLKGEGEAHDVPFRPDIPVPEPATLALLGLGLLAVATVRRAYPGIEKRIDPRLPMS